MSSTTTAPEKYEIGSRAECEQLVEKWGFGHVFTWTDGRRGSLTITYPKDNEEIHNGEVKKETFGVGARIDVPAGKVHEVWIGPEGCEYVIGE